MIHTKAQIENKAHQILVDIQREYFDDVPFYTVFEENLKDMYSGNIIEKGWHVRVYVHSDLLNTGKENPGAIVIGFDDTTGEPIYYADGSGGRSPIMRVRKKEDGKYYLGR